MGGNAPLVSPPKLIVSAGLAVPLSLRGGCVPSAGKLTELLSLRVRTVSCFSIFCDSASSRSALFLISSTAARDANSAANRGEGTHTHNHIHTRVWSDEP